MTGRMSRVKAALRYYSEMCSIDDLYAQALSNGRNDISVLRRRGWGIDSWWTAHNEGPMHKHYALTRDPERAVVIQEVQQMVLV